MKSVQGGVCLEPGAQGGACARRDPFSSFEVDSANRYGQFRDGVVSVAVEDGKVKIEVNQRYALKDAARAQADLEARKTTGSTILLP